MKNKNVHPMQQVSLDFELPSVFYCHFGAENSLEEAKNNAKQPNKQTGQKYLGEHRGLNRDYNSSKRSQSNCASPEPRFMQFRAI